MRAQKGFTLVELVIVIIIIGILSAAALPRFSGFASDSYDAQAQALLASVRSSVAMVKTKYESAGSYALDYVAYDGNTVYMSNSNWPECTGPATCNRDNMTSEADCFALWSLLIQNPPDAVVGTCTSGCDFGVTNGNNGADDNTTVCSFVQRVTNNRIDYNFSDGTVTLTLN